MAELNKVDYEVFYQKIDKAMNEAKEVIRYLSAGMITREAGEVQEAFYLKDGEAAHISSGILMHLLNVTRVIRYMNAHDYTAKDIGINEGDQFVNNDAFIGGMHNPDESIVEPFFYKGKHLGYVAGISHTSDVGAIESAGTCPSAREAIHDGLHLPAVKLVDRGLMRRDVMNMILRGCRDSTYVELDMRARMAGNQRAIKRLTELVDSVGVEFFEAACKKLVDDAEAFARDRIKQLRPGKYRSRVFDDIEMLVDGELKPQFCMLEVELEVTDKSEFILNVPIVSAENHGFDNAYVPLIEATIFYTILPLLMYDCRWNSGFNRAIKIGDIPDKSRISASANRSVNAAPISIGLVFSSALLDAFSRALYLSGRLDDVVGATSVVNSTGMGGTNQYGRMTVQSITSSCLPAGGAVLDHDGHEGGVTYFNPWSYSTDLESEELGLPIIHLTRNARPNSGGFGKFRGGNGVTNVTMVRGSSDIGLTKWGTGNKLPSTQGLFGAYPGSASFFDIMTDSNILDVIKEGGPLPYTDEALKALKGNIVSKNLCSTEKILHDGSIFASSSNGGGAGIGDPIERDPQMIVADLESESVTLDVAQKVYAVSIDPKTLKVNMKETEKLREDRKKERLAKGKPVIKYVQEMVKTREDKKLPKFLQDFYDQTMKFCPALKDEIDREKEIAAKGLAELKDIKVKKKLFTLTPYVDVMEDEKGKKFQVCSKCGHIHSDIKGNFKFGCLVYERATDDYHPGRLAYDKDWCTYREFYCPGCGTQVEVEGVSHGLPILWNYEIKG